MLTDKRDVEPMLRRAQAAVLCQGSSGASVEAFVEMDPEEAREKARREGRAFSRNVVCVELAGPELTDLSFVDLPGKPGRDARVRRV